MDSTIYFFIITNLDDNSSQSADKSHCKSAKCSGYLIQRITVEGRYLNIDSITALA